MRRSHIGMGRLGVFLLALAGTACENAKTEAPPDTYDPRWRSTEQAGSIFDAGGVRLFGDEDEAPANGIGVNAFLWRATLDTISFMPLISADPFGGVIITDWYNAPPESPDERFKMTVYILGRTLRSDGVQVSVFRQERGEDGLWEDRATSPDTAVSLEDKILDRARQLRTAKLSR